MCIKRKTARWCARGISRDAGITGCRLALTGKLHELRALEEPEMKNTHEWMSDSLVMKADYSPQS